MAHLTTLLTLSPPRKRGHDPFTTEQRLVRIMTSSVARRPCRTEERSGGYAARQRNRQPIAQEVQAQATAEAAFTPFSTPPAV